MQRPLFNKQTLVAAANGRGQRASLAPHREALWHVSRTIYAMVLDCGYRHENPEAQQLIDFIFGCYDNGPQEFEPPTLAASALARILLALGEYDERDVVWDHVFYQTDRGLDCDIPF